VTEWLGEIQPVVLVGGKSRRFGRDKLKEVVGAGGVWLVDRPLGALRAVFGARVAVVGECDGAVAARADMVIADTRTGVGPIGGILSALEGSGRDVFVLAGDLLNVDEGVVRAVLARAGEERGAVAVLAETEERSDAERRGTQGRGTQPRGTQIEPCIGLYRRGAMVHLARQLESGRRSLFDAVPGALVARVAIGAREAWNVNEGGEVTK
jgi:molybdopterin-guanine dinucleotide biosynthesis protein A